MRWRLHISFITECIRHCSSEEQDRSITAYQQILLLLSGNPNLPQDAGSTSAPAETPAAAAAELGPHPPSYAWCTRLKSRSACDLSSGSRCLSGWYSMHSRRYAPLSSSCDACEGSEGRLSHGPGPTSAPQQTPISHHHNQDEDWASDRSHKSIKRPILHRGIFHTIYSAVSDSNSSSVCISV